MSYLKNLENEIQLQSTVALIGFGTLLHWYGFFLLGILMEPIVKNQLFLNLEMSQYMSLVIFVIGFFVRPLGSILFGPWIDTKGRKNLFAYSLKLIALSMTLVLIFPFSYFSSYFGLAVLLFSRLLQGVAISIEYGAAVSYVYESVPKNRNGYFIGVLELTAPLGTVGAYVMYFISKQIFWETSHEYLTWKMPLLIGLILFVISSRIRKGLPESIEYEYLLSSGTSSKKPLIEFLTTTDKHKLLYSIFGVTAAQGTLFYLSSGILNEFVNYHQIANTDSVRFLYAAVVTIAWPVAFIPSMLADKFDPKKILIVLLILNLVIILVFTYSIEVIAASSANVWDIFFPIFFLFLCGLSVHALTTKILADIFPTKNRGTGISIPYHIGNGIFGGGILLLSNMSNKENSPFFGEKCYAILLVIIAIGFNLYMLSVEKKALPANN